jgi:CheY-like chemotaxis protein
MSSLRSRDFQTIVIAEDTADIRSLLALQLRMLGYTVYEAEDGWCAAQLTREKSPDLVLMDLCMPRMNGFEATKLIRQENNTAALKIVAFSAMSSNNEKVEALAAGCDEFVEKSLEFDKVRAMVQRVLAH